MARKKSANHFRMQIPEIEEISLSFFLSPLFFLFRNIWKKFLKTQEKNICEYFVQKSGIISCMT